ncbi:MAG TPA: hypothetical protein VF096_00095 [Azonexus sp.]
MSAKSFAPSPLIAAIRAGRPEKVTAALDAGGDLEEADIHGCAGLPLRTACFEGHAAIVGELLRRGADVNALAADGPGAPIRLALRGGHPHIAALLLDHAAQRPPGIDLAADILARIAPAPADSGPTIEEVDITACYGTDTNLLTLELSAPAPTAARPGFWKSGRLRD